MSAPPIDPGHVRLEIGKTGGKSIHISIPGMDRHELLDVAATFFATYRPDMKRLIREALDTGGDLTITMTTRRTLEDGKV